MPDDLHHVTSVHQRGDTTVRIDIQTDSFQPGQEVEVSVYLTQGDSYAMYNEKKRIPLPDPNNPGQPGKMHVELPATNLDPMQEVTVVTRVAEVWPSVLQQDLNTLKEYQNQGVGVQGLTAVWTYQESAGKEQGDTESPSTGNGAGEFVKTPQP
jgi:hypothetical protein